MKWRSELVRNNCPYSRIRQIMIGFDRWLWRFPFHFHQHIGTHNRCNGFHFHFNGSRRRLWSTEMLGTLVTSFCCLSSSFAFFFRFTWTLSYDVRCHDFWKPWLLHKLFYCLGIDSIVLRYQLLHSETKINNNKWHAALMTSHRTQTLVMPK